MLNLYLKQLMEAKKKVFEAMSNGDFSAVQETMEKYKKMEEILQKPIYNRIMNMSNEEFLNLVQALRTKGVSIEETITKKDLISKFMNFESIANEESYDFSKKNIIQVSCVEVASGYTRISIGNTGFPGQEIKYHGGNQVFISSELAKKLEINTSGVIGGPGEIGTSDAKRIIRSCESAIKDFDESYEFILDRQKFIKYVKFLEELNNMTIDYIDLSSREYVRQTKMFSVESSAPSMNMLCSIDDIREKLNGLIRITNEQGESKTEEKIKNPLSISHASNDLEAESTIKNSPSQSDLINEVCKCESLADMKKKATNDITWYTADNIKSKIYDCLKCYVSRKELIRKISLKVVLLYDEIIVKFGYPSVIDKKLFSTNYSGYKSCYNACEGYNDDIDWFSILMSLHDNNVLEKLESDMKELRELINYLSKQIENQKLFDKIKSEANNEENKSIPELPTFGGTFEFESDVEPIADYLAENQKQR